MVDAINGVSGNTKPQDLSIDWNSCTADEVIGYSEDGQDVPSDVLAWAQDMENSDNADKITYEMAMSGEDGTQGNAATDMRDELADSGVSLKEQGKIFISESKDKEELTLESISKMAPLMDTADEITTEAEKIGNTTTTKLEEIKSQIESLKSGSLGGLLLSREERGQVAGLKAVADALTSGAEKELEGLDGELADVEALVNEGASNSGLAEDFGTETIAIGQELLGKRSALGTAVGTVVGLGLGGILGGIAGGVLGGIFGSGKRKVGKQAVQQGAETLTTGQQGTDIAQQAAEAQGVSIKTVEKESTDIEGQTTNDENGTTGDNPTAQDDPNAVGTTENEPAAEGEAKIAEEDPSKIVTDPNEILKRKERKGIA